MNNFRIYFLTAILALLAIGCAKETEPQAQVSEGVVFHAAINDMTKAVLKPGAAASKVEWVAGDLVSVFADGTNYQYRAEQSGASSDLLPQGGSSNADEYFALYPYDADAVVADGIITTSLPAEQQAVINSFSAHLAVAYSTSLSLGFKNVCGLFKVTVAEPNITKVEFKGNAGEIVAGDVNVTVSGEPSWTAVDGSGSRTVSLVAEDGESLAETDYYMEILPQIFDAGVTVTAYYADGTSKVKEIWDPVTIERNGLVGGAFKTGYWKVETVMGNPASTADKNVAGTGFEVSLKNAQDIVLAPDGNFWITTRCNTPSNHGVWEMTSDTYTLTNIALSATDAENYQENLIGAHPWGGCFDSDGMFYFAAKAVAKLLTCDAEGTVEPYEVKDATLTNIMKVLADDNGNLYLLVRGSGAGKGMVLKVTDHAVVEQWNLTSLLYEMMCFSYDKTKIFVFSNTSGDIQMINLEDSSITRVAGTGKAYSNAGEYTDGTPGQPLTATVGVVEGAICAADGTIYFTEIKGVVRIFKPDASGDYSKGSIKTIMGQPYTLKHNDGIGTEATFVYPNGIALAEDGETLYMIDGTGKGTVRKLTFVEE